MSFYYFDEELELMESETYDDALEFATQLELMAALGYQCYVKIYRY